MSDELWFRFHPSKFMAGIRGLNANEVKVYISLLCRMYERGGPIRNDAEILSTYCEMRRSSFEKALARLIRLEKIRVTEDGRIFNDAAEREISQRASKSEFAKRAGKKSAEKRQEKQRQQANDRSTTAEPEEKIREEKKIDGDDARASAAEDPPEKTHRENLIEAMGGEAMTTTGRALGNRDDMREVEYWTGPLGIPEVDQVAVVAAVMARKPDGPPTKFGYFRQAMEREAAERDAHAARMAAPPDLRVVPSSADPPARPQPRRIRPDPSAVEDYRP